MTRCRATSFTFLSRKWSLLGCPAAHNSGQVANERDADILGPLALMLNSIIYSQCYKSFSDFTFCKVF